MSLPSYYSEDNDAFTDLSLITVDPPGMRSICTLCERPQTVCWCPFLPEKRLNIKSSLYILQHPSEIKKCLRTSPILQNSLEPSHCHVIRGKKFPGKHKHLQSIFDHPDTILLYPVNDAVQVSELDLSRTYNIVIVDGTWPQAKSMYNGSKALKSLKKVALSVEEVSKYVIKTQPNDKCLSTVESAAIVLSIIEDNPNLKEELIRPLHALCQFQLDHGAVRHHSRQYRNMKFETNS